MKFHPVALPPRPLTSRFVAPWDTSGWYELHGNLAPGAAVYTNAAVTIASLPEDLLGGDWIATFDSLAQGFDDKGGMDFYAERDIFVTVALDAAANPAFLEGFARREGCVSLSDGRTCPLYERRYASDSLVSLPGFKGEYHHYFVLIRSAAQEAEEGAPQTVSVDGNTTIAPAAPKKWYVDEHFCGPWTANALLRTEGETSLAEDADFPGNQRLRLHERAAIQWYISTTGQDRAEIELEICGQAKVTCCGAELLLTEEGLRCEGGDIPAVDGRYNLILLRSEKGLELHVNLYHMLRLPCEGGSEHTLRIEAAGGEVLLDTLSLRDDFEAPLRAWTEEGLRQSLTLPEGSDAAMMNHPALGSVVELTGAAALPLPSMDKEARLEIIAKPLTGQMTVLADVRDPAGEAMLQVCAYRSNLYATDGGRWVRLLEADKPHSYDPANCWYHLSLEIDVPQGRYTLLVDGARRAIDFATTGGTALGQIGFASAEGMLLHSLRLWDAASVSRGLLPPGPVFDVKAAPYHAVGDGAALDTRAIQRAVDDASRVGGTVYLHDGRFLVEGVDLRSNVTLWIDPSATVQGHEDFTVYPVRRACESLIAVKWVRRGVIHGERVKNVRILGGGMVDANGRCRFKVNNPVQADGYDVRPSNIFITLSQHIEIRDVHLTNAAFWTLVPLSSRHVLIEDLDLDCMNTPNRDGIDPVDCQELAVRRCRILAGDDGFCPKSSYVDGCRHILAEDLMIQSLASGIKFGTDSYRSFCHMTVRRCICKNINRCGMSVETVDGAVIEDVHFDQIDVEDAGGALYLTIGRRGRRTASLPERVAQGCLRGVSFCRIHYDNPYQFSHAPWIHECMVIGLDEEHLIENVEFRECVFRLPGGCKAQPRKPRTVGGGYPEYDKHGPSAGAAFTLMYTKNVQFHDCDFTLAEEDVRPLIAQL